MRRREFITLLGGEAAADRRTLPAARLLAADADGCTDALALAHGLPLRGQLL
jgi:hypothetical protein